MQKIPFCLCQGPIPEGDVVHNGCPVLCGSSGYVVRSEPDEDVAVSLVGCNRGLFGLSRVHHVVQVQVHPIIGSESDLYMVQGHKISDQLIYNKYCPTLKEIHSLIVSKVPKIFIAWSLNKFIFWHLRDNQTVYFLRWRCNICFSIFCDGILTEKKCLDLDLKVSEGNPQGNPLLWHHKYTDLFHPPWSTK